MKTGFEGLKLVLEPSGAVALAAALSGQVNLRGARCWCWRQGATSPLPALLTVSKGQILEMTVDYVIVGAGSAGCAMAYRLGQAGKSVIVIEDGGIRRRALHPDAGRAVLPDEHAPL